MVELACSCAAPSEMHVHKQHLPPSVHCCLARKQHQASLQLRKTLAHHSPAGSGDPAAA